jgi:AcrR family transcriptional regulator
MSTTRELIVETAADLFSELGYETASIGEIQRRCGISRGALYHHFPSKEALFTAVFERVETQILETVSFAAKETTNPLDGLRLGCSAWLDLAAQDRSVRQIVLTDAPSVVGWQNWRKLEEQYGLGLIRSAFERASAVGLLPPTHTDFSARTLLAVLTEAAMMVGQAEDKVAAVQLGRDIVEQVLTRLMNLQPKSSWPKDRKADSY